MTRDYELCSMLIKQQFTTRTRQQQNDEPSSRTGNPLKGTDRVAMRKNTPTHFTSEVPSPHPLCNSQNKQRENKCLEVWNNTVSYRFDWHLYCRWKGQLAGLSPSPGGSDANSWATCCEFSDTQLGVPENCLKGENPTRQITRSVSSVLFRVSVVVQ